MPNPSPPAERRAHFLPDFCSAPAIAEILVIAELVAMVLTMARGVGPGVNVLQDFIGISLFMLWLAFASAAVLCIAGRRLEHLPAIRAYLVCYVLLLLTTAVISAAGAWIDREAGLGMIRQDAWLAFVSVNLSISAIVSAVALRYFHVQYQWRRQVRREAGARIEALQARIRPHFLFNSMNTIAALIPAAPEAAEQAVEDLSDLFRASLDDTALVALNEEVALARLYQRLEEKRLGDRLQVDWQIAPGNVRLPRLTLQPLLENAIHHGIEKLPQGGCVTVLGEVRDGRYRLLITNPVPAGATERHGFKIALENTRERLALALGARATLATRREAGYFETEVLLPLEPDHARTDR